ncbi:hypothetical protein JZ751_020273 [Albula glossodonta]|uniref:Uncharacterized protein n=1 Tax=Albula glossodonta TaxID=121402 RepID=A0A8T2MSK2_9TELE|nr:hypothetical protein JZ751_020273 [Albula glossodonta]
MGCRLSSDRPGQWNRSTSTSRVCTFPATSSFTQRSQPHADRDPFKPVPRKRSLLPHVSVTQRSHLGLTISVGLRQTAPISVGLWQTAPISVGLQQTVLISVGLRQTAPISVGLRQTAPISVNI